MTLETLVVTMNQTDFSLCEKMNIQTDAVIANQAGVNSYEEKTADSHRIKMVTTDTVGVGINRNIAFINSSADIILFTDDDFRFVDGYGEKIIEAFEKNKDADVIIFNRNLTKNGEITEVGRNADKRIRLYNSMQYGACALAIKRASMQKARITFSHLFGGGCIYGSGEDSLFILDCLRKKLKLYSNSFCLGLCASDTSSWFKGYNEKYFYDKGAFIAAAFPKMKTPICLYFCWRFKSKTEISPKEMYKLMKKGIKEYGFSEPKER